MTLTSCGAEMARAPMFCIGAHPSTSDRGKRPTSSPTRSPAGRSSRRLISGTQNAAHSSRAREGQRQDVNHEPRQLQRAQLLRKQQPTEELQRQQQQQRRLQAAEQQRIQRQQALQQQRRQPHVLRRLQALQRSRLVWQYKWQLQGQKQRQPAEPDSNMNGGERTCNMALKQPLANESLAVSMMLCLSRVNCQGSL